MTSLTASLEAGVDLSDRQIRSCGEFLLDQSAETDGKVALLRALTQKGETARELLGFVEFFLSKAERCDFSAQTEGYPSIDVCGTGGDQLDLFNISTTSMFVLAAGGAKVIKHGNRGITSQSGGADVLEFLGIPLRPTIAQNKKALEEANLCFLFAPHHHPAFQAVGQARKILAEEGMKTLFNLIGPLLNPASPTSQLIGLTDPARLGDFAEILQKLGRKSVWVVSGETQDGLPVDELSTMGPNSLVKGGSAQPFAEKTIEAADFGLPLATHEELKGGDAAKNARILLAILQGRERGPKRDIVLFNAGAGLACAGLCDTLGSGVKRAAELLDSGAAAQQFTALQEAFA